MGSAATKSGPTHKLIHYDSKTCPYAQRSWITLLEKQLPFEIEVVDLQDKPEHFKELYASIHPDPAASAKVPILIDGDTKLIESQIVVEYLISKYAGCGEKLMPDDPAAAAKARLFVEIFTSSINSAIFGIIRADTAEGVAASKDKLAAGLKTVDTCLRRHGSEDGGSYFLGAQFTIADVCTLTFLQRGMAVLPAYRNIDVWEMMKEQDLGRLEQWAKAVLDRPSAKETVPPHETLVKSWAKFVTPLK